MELVDIADLSSAASNGVWVRVPLRVPFYLVVLSLKVSASHGLKPWQ